MKEVKAWKIVLIILLMKAVIIGGAGMFFGIRLERIVSTYLEAKTKQLSGGFYKISIDGIRIEILKRCLKIDHITFYPDSAAFAHLQAVDSLPDLFVHLNIHSVEARGLNILARNNQKGVNLKNLWINRPEVWVTQTGYKKDTNKQNISKSLYQMISPTLHTVDIEKINIDEGNFRFSQWHINDTVEYQVTDVGVMAQHFLVDSTADMRQRMFYCDDVQLEVNDFHHMLPGGLFEVSFDKMKIRVADSLLVFDGLKLIPQYDKQHFAAKNPRHTNWMKLDIESLQCVKVDFPKILSEKSVNIDSILIEGISYVNMKNREVEQAPIVKPMVYEYIQHLPIPLNIRTIHVPQAMVVYEDLPKGESEPGVLTFNKMTADFYDITNIVSKQNQYMTIKASAYVQNEGILRAIFKFPVDPNNDHFDISGTLGSMHLTRLNPMIESFRISVKEGVVKDINFVISGGRVQASLDMQFLYNDLHVFLLKSKDHHMIKKYLASSIVNGMLLFNDNPSSDEEPRRPHTMTERNIYRASFHYFWHTLASGLTETVGMTKKRQEQLAWLKQEASKMHILREE